ncbi:pentapeptide repeat-containing protein [Rhodococcoides fascians]|uniref:pentapeptide repeat-containing protein n=1 Tax=Rhodococcoides fascians TaxID=1828 RepID=UPI000B2EA0C1|nr:pentapeptide repeat-containing protein [Rhodococcus fascians]
MSSPEPVPTPPDGTTTPTTPTNEPTHHQVRAWIKRHEIALSAWIKRHKIALVTCFAVGFVGGFLLPGNTWNWYLRQDITPGHGTIIGGLFVVIAAAIAYTGTHLTRTSTERIAIAKNDLDKTNAENAHNLTDIQELRRRFVTTTAQFADPSPEVRLAGVYALEALTNDWIDRENHTDAQTCINYLCGYLTRPYTPPTKDPHLRQTVVTPDIATTVQRTYIHPHDDLNVRQAITRTIAKHLQPGDQHSWSTYDYDLTGAYFDNADFTRCVFRGTIEFTNAHFDGAQTLFANTEFHGTKTSFQRARFYGYQASFVQSQFHSPFASFAGAQFRSGRAVFDEAEFHGERTVFSSARFYSDWTSFIRAQSHGDITFASTRFVGEKTTFEYAQFRGPKTDFAGTLFAGKATTFVNAQFHSPRTSFAHVQFNAASTSFHRALFCGTRTMFHKVWFVGETTTFEAAQFRSDWTKFHETRFLSTSTSFESAEYIGTRTRFTKIDFGNGVTSFDNPVTWNNVYFDWDPPIPYAVRASQPPNVTPHNWPPTSTPLP